MKIGIDARFYGLQGPGRYTRELVRNLAKLDTENEYVIFVMRDSLIDALPKNFSISMTSTNWYGLREQLLWPHELRKHKFDILHFTHFNVPFLYRRPYVVTIHDLILFRTKSAKVTTRSPFIFWVKYLIYKILLKSTIRRAARIITVSNYSKKDIIEQFPIAAKKTVVTYEGVSLREPSGVQEAIDPRLKPHKFLLYVGNAFPHKNLKFLVDTFLSWNQMGQYRLALVGKKDVFYERLERSVPDAGNASIIFTGYVTDEALRSYYETALAYVFPSLYEGFGLPPLEAMAADLPVLASDSTCIPEILGDAALYFQPANPASLRSALTQAVRNSELRRKLVQKGRRRVMNYSWYDMSRTTKDLYASIET